MDKPLLHNHADRVVDFHMGVVYKLKQEVIDFIVLKKKDNPSVSCRSLVDIIKRDFSLEVSKSSVNSVIKEFQLSSPVGRRPIYKAPKNFFIPQDKKEQLLKNMAPFLSEGMSAEKAPSEKVLGTELMAKAPSAPEPLPVLDSISGPAPDREPIPVSPDSAGSLQQEESKAVLESHDGESVSGDNFVAPASAENIVITLQSEQRLISDEHKAVPLLEKPTVLEEQEPVSPEAGSPLHLLPDPFARTSVSEERRVDIELSRVDLREEAGHECFWGKEKGFLYENLGLLLAGAVLWDMQRRPFLGEMVAGELKEPVEPGQLPGLELVFLYHLLLEDDPPLLSLDGGKFLFDLFGLEEHGVSEWVSEIDLLKDDKKFLLAGSSLMETAGTLVASFRIAMKNGSVFYFDPLFSSCTTEFGGAHKNLVPLFSAAECIGDVFITNAHPFVLEEIPFSLSDERSASFFALFDGKNDVDEVALLDAAGEKMAVFNDIPRIPRRFIAGAHFSPAEVAMVDTEMIGNSVEYFDPFEEQTLFYFEGTFPSPFLGQGTRAMMLGRKEKKDFALLSNMNDKAKDVFFAYSSAGKTIFHGKEHENSSEKHVFMGKHVENNIKNDNNAPLIGHSNDFKTQLEEAIKPLFSENHIDYDDITIRKIFRTSGYYKNTRRGVFIRLAPSGEKAFLDVFERCVFSLNRRAISSYDGQRVHFSLERP